MSHYFESPTGPDIRRRISATIFGRELTFATSAGVFAGQGLDRATAVLLREVDVPAGPVRIADVGCGWGPIAIGLALANPEARVDAVDVNDRALALCRENADYHGVADRVRVVRPDDAGTGYDQIWSNPPIRIGKDALHALLLDWLPRLRPGGEAFWVVGKNLGADSLQAWLTDQGWPTQRLASAKGFRVLRTTAR